MASQHMTVGELSSFLMYTFWVGISIAGNTHAHTHALSFSVLVHCVCVFVCDGLWLCVFLLDV